MTTRNWRATRIRRLSTLVLPNYEMGQRAAEALLDIAVHGKQLRPMTIKIDGPAGAARLDRTRNSVAWRHAGVARANRLTVAHCGAPQVAYRLRIQGCMRFAGQIRSSTSTPSAMAIFFKADTLPSFLPLSISEI